MALSIGENTIMPKPKNSRLSPVAELPILK
jgi:hypothetical protein